MKDTKTELAITEKTPLTFNDTLSVIRSFLDRKSIAALSQVSKWHYMADKNDDVYWNKRMGQEFFKIDIAKADLLGTAKDKYLYLKKTAEANYYFIRYGLFEDELGFLDSNNIPREKNNSFFQAMKNGEITEVKKLDEEFRQNKFYENFEEYLILVDGFGHIAMEYAAYYGHEELISYLLGFICYISGSERSKNIIGRVIAAGLAGGHEDVINTLFERYFNFEKIGTENDSAKKLYTLVLETLANYGEFKLFQVYFEKMRDWLTKDSSCLTNINNKIDINHLIHLAAKKGDIEAVSFFSNINNRITGIDNQRNTLFHYFSKAKYPEIFEILEKKAFEQVGRLFEQRFNVKHYPNFNEFWKILERYMCKNNKNNEEEIAAEIEACKKTFNEKFAHLKENILMMAIEGGDDLLIQFCKDLELYSDKNINFITNKIKSELSRIKEISKKYYPIAKAWYLNYSAELLRFLTKDQLTKYYETIGEQDLDNFQDLILHVLRNGNKTITQLLIGVIDFSKDIVTEGKKGVSGKFIRKFPLYIVIETGKIEIANMLLEQVKDIEINSGYIEEVWIYNKNDLLTLKKRITDSPLSCAIRKGYDEIAYKLIEKSAKINPKEMDMKFVIKACNDKRNIVVDKLVAGGLNLLTYDKNGKLLCHYVPDNEIIMCNTLKKIFENYNSNPEKSLSEKLWHSRDASKQSLLALVNKYKNSNKNQIATILFLNYHHLNDKQGEFAKYLKESLAAILGVNVNIFKSKDLETVMRDKNLLINVLLENKFLHACFITIDRIETSFFEKIPNLFKKKEVKTNDVTLLYQMIENTTNAISTGQTYVRDLSQLSETGRQKIEEKQAELESLSKLSK